MDPYLEERSVWSDVHQRMITYIAENLQPQLRPNYIARLEERIQVADIGSIYRPYVLVGNMVREPAPSLVTAEGLAADEPQHLEVYHEPAREPFIEIIARESHDVVTVIEVLSPANKVGDGREECLRKQKELQATEVNLVEIDLLSYGKATVLARRSTITEPADWRYIIKISRAGKRQSLEVYAVALREKLPNCRIPLRPPDEDVVLDLTAVFNRCYDIGGYDLFIDYTKPPFVLLTDAEIQWVDALLQEKGLRVG
jgi:hypothetical protein